MQTQQWTTGDEIAGFKLLSITPLEEYRGTGYHFIHIETNMEVFQLVNDDIERFFSYVFKTLPANDSGVAHILEHCVLAGSKRYPVRDPFMSLLKGSANTFMNAMTFPDKTLYLAASPLKTDFDNLFSVYTDAVFAPLLREETFWQEGVRLVCTEEGCHFEGVVFNEMLGDGSNHDSIVGRNSVRSLFPDTPYAFNSGGDPGQIIKLDYQQFISFYNQYYHPSNAKLFLYGDLEVGEQLAWLDEHYLQRRGSINVASTAPLAAPWKGERSVVYTSPSEDGEGVKANSVLLSWACGEVTNSLEVVTLSTLVEILLGNPAAPLYHELIESGLGEDISPESGMSADFRQMPFLVGFKGIDDEVAEEAKVTILSALEEIVESGLDKDLVASSLKRSQFRLLEIPGGLPNGLRILNRSLRGWIYGAGPLETIGAAVPLQRLQEALEENPRYFEEWIQQHLLDNPHRCLITVKADEEHNARELDAITKYAAKIVDELGKKGIKEVQLQNERFTAFEEQKDDQQALDTIPRLLVDDLPKTIRENTHQVLKSMGRDLFVRTRFSNTIVYLNIAIDISDLSEDEMRLLPFYIRLVQMTGAGTYTYSEIATHVKRLLGDVTLFLEMGTDLDGEARELVLCRAKMLAEDTQEALDLVATMLTQAHLDEPKRLKQVLNNLKGSFRDSVSYSAHTYAALHAAQHFSEVQYAGEQLSGLSQWLYLEEIAEEDLPALGQRLTALQHRLNNRNRLTFHLLCDEERVAEIHPIIDRFALAFKEGAQIKSLKTRWGRQEPETVNETVLFRLPSTVSYQGWALRSEKRGSLMQSAQTLLAPIMSGNDLWEAIRARGGAYGVSATIDIMEEIFVFATYRDPRIADSLADIKRILEQYGEQVVDRSLIDNALITSIGAELRPLSPGQESLLSFRRLLYKISDEFRAKRREDLLSLNAEDIRESAKLLAEGAQRSQSLVVLSGKHLLDEQRKKDERYDRPATRLPL